ncbi:uncharacterized protein Dwil_GK25711 [Drosophila willistoni]|uniref:CWF19-like protein 2 homolog n=1 Tax=Drosophila willistoni TaxID=7260 RepID=B4NEV5_DROWI|nr:CWF19-like protein 2 homolog [Drosophila willistoni]EDW82274.1 uncharacterized protein Dwil_GK25711 [Drosophila willistoni]
MSFIQFESGREKDKARQELREARAELLAQAQSRAEHRSRREREQELRGEANWMLPAVAKKLDSSKVSSKKAKSSKSKKKLITKSKAKTKEKNKSSKKKSKKHHHKRRSSSSSDSDSDDSSSSSSDSTSSSSSSDDETKRRRLKKKSQKSHKSDDEWVEKKPVETPVEPLQRDSWMTSENLRLKTFMRERKEPTKPNEKMQQIDAYDPAKSVHELNPYWKSNGTGLPGFQKPQDESTEYSVRQEQYKPSSSSGWRKASVAQPKPKSPSPKPSSDSSQEEDHEQEDEEMYDAPACLTDEQINELASKAIKAELKGKSELAKDLNVQLEAARKARAEFLASGKQPPKRTKSKSVASSSEHVLLTRTDQKGQVRPLIQSRSKLEPSTGERDTGVRKKKKMDTHVDGQRVRYFADDDRYDIKQMFEREKHSTAAESNLEYANMLSKHKNPNDDLEDIFSDRIRKNGPSQAEEEKRERQAAIREHERLTSTLENCDRCLDSGKLDKQLLVSLGQRIYLSLPWHIGLQNGHCILSPMQHVACCTQLDEDAWQELNDFRKSLTRMFASQGKDCVFYEIANKLHRRPHLSVHCIPIPNECGEVAPFYFKKAIEESEQEWCINKQLVTLKAQKSLRSSIPKGLPYIWVHFGMDTGFAHVIEDQDRFPNNFVQEIIGGMLELNPNAWRKPRKEQNIIAKVKSLADKWKNYDCTES